MLDLEWQDYAACRRRPHGEPPRTDLFYSYDETSKARALLICATCPVRPACRDYAARGDEIYGVWGGETETERRRNRQVSPRPPKPVPHGTPDGWAEHRRRHEKPCAACAPHRPARAEANR